MGTCMAKWDRRCGDSVGSTKHLAHCRTALVLAPDDARIQNQLGLCLGDMGEHDAALGHFETAARLDPSNYEYHSNVCSALWSLGRYSDAIVPAQRAVDLAPDDSLSAIRLGMLLDHQGLHEKAEHYLEKATQVAPSSAKAHHQLGAHFSDTGQHAKAVVCFQRAIELEENAQRFELLGVALAGASRWPEAEAAFRHGLTLEPNHSGMRADLGATLANLGRFSEGVELLEAVLRDDPENVEAKRMLAQVRGARGWLKRSLRAVLRVFDRRLTNKPI